MTLKAVEEAKNAAVISSLNPNHLAVMMYEKVELQLFYKLLIKSISKKSSFSYCLKVTSPLTIIPKVV